MRVVLSGREFEIAPYKLGQVEEAAPYFDQMNDLSERLKSGERKVANVVAMEKCVLGILLPGLRKSDPSITMEWLMENVSQDEVLKLRETVPELQREAGFQTKGEDEPPVSGQETTPAAETTAP